MFDWLRELIGRGGSRKIASEDRPNHWIEGTNTVWRREDEDYLSMLSRARAKSRSGESRRERDKVRRKTIV